MVGKICQGSVNQTNNVTEVEQLEFVRHVVLCHVPKHWGVGFVLRLKFTETKFLAHSNIARSFIRSALADFQTALKARFPTSAPGSHSNVSYSGNFRLIIPT